VPELPVGAGTYSALIDFSDPHDPGEQRLRLAFGAVRLHLQAHTLADVRGVLDAVQAHSMAGRWCVGYVAYEAAPAFDAAFAVHAPSDAQGPLAWFAVYDQALPWPAEAPSAPSDDRSAAPSAELRVDWNPLLARAEFDAAMDTLLQAIGQGELYQVNFTTQMQGMLALDAGASQGSGAQALFAALQRAQPGGYAAYLDTGSHGQVLSVSPELFFDWRDGDLLARPMKGTARRGHSPEEDAALAQTLRSSPKERAENVMVVDLLRNDMSRVAEAFSVKVPRLFHTEALATVWQMTSDVTARTRAGTRLSDVFGALFPCGSVTGAPKVRAMQMIRQLEPQARGVYCGALGVLQPGGVATFNVPIRTVTLQGAQARCGIGSGITADARAPGEWQEWGYKQAFVRRASQTFSLLETLALHSGVFRHLDAHLARMQAGALHFGTPWDELRVRDCLQVLAMTHGRGLWRVRLLLDARGVPQAQVFALLASPARVRLQLADRPIVEAHSEFVRFKTTRRAHYDAFNPTDEAVFDTLLWNPQGEITECIRGNVAFLLDGRWVTPALSCGLLGGVGRAQALVSGRVAEAVVRLEDLARATEVAFVNSLRGWLAADLHLSTDHAVTGDVSSA
jgi:para-aminobenzoate synthetase/4-amino-4-deoxychorismate lyase